MPRVLIDGSRGEGGGQILRTAIALSLVTRQALRFENVRARRKVPGLRPQHRTAVLAAARIGAARVSGADVGSRTLEFEPGALIAGTHRFDVGTAGSTTLVLQTILPALLAADAPSSIEIVGGTHNPLAPSFDFIERAYVPLLRRMGADVRVNLERHGFHPAGGGVIRCEVVPGRLSPLELHDRGAPIGRRARALVSRLPAQIAERELDVVAKRLDIAASDCELVEVVASGPGNAISIELEHEHVTEVFSAVGQRGIRAETVASQAAKAALVYERADVAVGAHLADQLLLPLALAGGGSFTTLEPTLHTRTNADVISELLPIAFEFAQDAQRFVVRACAKP